MKRLFNIFFLFTGLLLSSLGLASSEVPSGSEANQVQFSHQEVNNKPGSQMIAEMDCIPLFGVLRALSISLPHKAVRLAVGVIIMTTVMVQAHQIKLFKPCRLKGWTRTWRLTWTTLAAIGISNLLTAFVNIEFTESGVIDELLGYPEPPKVHQ